MEHLVILIMTQGQVSGTGSRETGGRPPWSWPWSRGGGWRGAGGTSRIGCIQPGSTHFLNNLIDYRYYVIFVRI